MRFARAYTRVLSAAALTVAGLLCGCGQNNARHAVTATDDVLVQYGDSVLTVQAVVSRIPPGLDAADSLALLNAIADDWITTMMLEQEAEKYIGTLAEIDRMTRDYRRRLLLERYRDNAARRSAGKVSRQEVQQYYAAHPDEFVLDRPIIKGLLLKLPANSEHLDNARKWVSQATPRSIDRLEKHALGEALSYEYFMSTWQDWDDISSRIPHTFGAADPFVASHKFFEVTYGDAVYLLHISEYLPSGRPMPAEYACSLITERLQTARRADADAAMLRSMERKAIRNGTLIDTRKTTRGKSSTTKPTK